MTASPGHGAAARGLDALNLFVGNIQTGFGPFIVVYLTTRGWTQTSIGIALSVGTISAMASQLPAGALVDAVRRKSFVVVASLVAFTVCGLVFAFAPIRLLVYLAEILHGFSSCTLGPAIATMSLALVGRGALGPRLGRNARFAAIGTGAGAALMGACGYYLSNRAVFFLTAALTLPAVATVWPLRWLEPARVARPPGTAPRDISVWRLLSNRPLVTFALCTMLFALGNSALLPLVSSAMTRELPKDASLLIAALVVLPQLVVVAISPSLGKIAEAGGRRPILILVLAVLGIRGFLFAAVSDPGGIVSIQLLDGVSAAGLGVLTPLVTADLAGDSGHYNIAQGLVGLAVGVGATLSTTFAAIIADRVGEPVALSALGLVGLGAALFAFCAMPETRVSLPDI